MSYQHHMTVTQLRDYCEAHIATGHGDANVALDRRGLHFLTDKQEVYVGLPHDGNTHDADNVYVRVIF